MITLPAKHRILIVDDEPDIHSVTKLSLRGFNYHGRALEFAFASSGQEAIEAMQRNPDTSIILLDVVMETASAGLDACRAIRAENKFVRILLRTGQPGAAPEKQTIDEYDIDNYLPKAELTTTRLYVAVRTALKAYEELVELERHRQLFSFIHDSVLSLRSFEPLEWSLQRILATAVAIAPSRFAVLDLHTVASSAKLQRCLLHQSEDAARGYDAAVTLAEQVATSLDVRTLPEAAAFADGHLWPLTLHRDLGYGWIYLEGGERDPLTLQALSLLGSHAANALYSAVAQAMLTERTGALL